MQPAVASTNSPHLPLGINAEHTIVLVHTAVGINTCAPTLARKPITTDQSPREDAWVRAIQDRGLGRWGTADSEAVHMQVSDAGREQRSSTATKNRNSDMERTLQQRVVLWLMDAGEKYVAL